MKSRKINREKMENNKIKSNKKEKRFDIYEKSTINNILRLKQRKIQRENKK